MSRGPGVGLSLGVIVLAALIAAAITTWAASPMKGSEPIYRPQYPLVY
jgi:hypothetical protein